MVEKTSLQNTWEGGGRGGGEREGWRGLEGRGGLERVSQGLKGVDVC